MKSIFILLLFVQVACLSSFSQTNCRLLRIYCITEYEDGYVIKGIDENSNDTLSIISKRDTMWNKSGYERLQVGNKYRVQVENRVGRMSAMPLEHFVVRIVSTIVWKNGDRVRDIPLFSNNIKDLYIKEDK